jgi:hypothetical protein
LKGRDVQEVEKKDMLVSPAGPPVSLGPQSFVTPEGRVQSMLPLFHLSNQRDFKKSINHHLPHLLQLGLDR